MKKILIALVVVIIIPIAYWTISPLFTEKVVDEKIEDITDNQNTIITLSQGSFIGQGAHNAEGEVKLIKDGEKTFLRFEDGFQVTNGPDLFVHFGKDGKYVNEARIGELKGNIGGQNYEIPEDIDPDSYNEIWIWCRAFSVAFARAELK